MTPQEHIKELRDALGALYAVQNGPPLCKDELEWCRAMDEAERLLAMDALPPPPDKPKRGQCYWRPDNPVECVFDTPDECCNARQLIALCKPREDCPYWREIKEEG